MLRNNILIALRLLAKNKVFSLINILGLATGIACCVLITLYVQDEFSYEKGFADHAKIFRINTVFISDGEQQTGPVTSPAIGPGLAEALPQIEQYTRVMPPPNTDINIIRYKDKSFFEKKALLVDSTFLEVFPYQLVEGNAATALDDPSTTLISEQLAAKIFGESTPLDELLIINSGTSADTFRITGVVKKSDLPSHLDADVYMCMNSDGWGRWVLSQTTWTNNNMVGAYVKLRDAEAFQSLEPKFAQLMEMHAGDELRKSGRGKILKLQPLDDVRLHTELRKGGSRDGDSGSITYIYIVGTIGVLILLLACINFMNLTTAKSAQRAGEVGIRKSMGAFRINLIRQFLGESMVIVVFALILAFMLVALVLPAFNTIMQKHLQMNVNNIPFIVGAAVAIALATGLLAGTYPAFFLSSLKPTQVLKGKSLSGDGSQWLRKGLVVFQFVITIMLISSIVIIQKQLKFIQSKSLGFNTEEVIIIPMRTASASAQYESLKNTLENMEGVKLVSATSSVPSTPLTTDWKIYKEGASNEESIAHDIVRVDAGYFDVLDIDLIAGRDFIVGQDNLPNDTVSPTKIIVNEASLRDFGIPVERAVGTNIFFQPDKERYEFLIVGVVKDFHQFSLHREIAPMLFLLSGDRRFFPYITASINMASYETVQKNMKAAWNERIYDAPFESIFLNENVKALYAAEQRTSTMLGISTLIAIVISCLGLYGLSVYVAARKTKEIGIRKVVGASVESIVAMLSKEYIKLMMISFIIAVPLGYYAMDRWLEGFAYRITPGLSVFIISGLLSFFIAWLTVGFESFRAARKNPVDTFRVN
jgi:putative ABC transport system permease protein